MIDKFTNKPLLVVIYPYKFHDFTYDLMELDHFKPYCDVLVWDISPITTPSFARAISAGRSRKEEVIVLSSLLDFLRHVSGLRKRSVEAKVCIVNEVTNGSLIEVICNLIIIAFLKTKSVAILDLYNGGLPLRYLGGAAKAGAPEQKLGFLAKGLRFAREASTLSEVKKRVSEVLFSRLARLLPSATTHRLVAGEDWLPLAQVKGREKPPIRLVYGHSHDYSNSLLYELKSSAFVPPRNKRAVFLDGAAPMFGSDAALGRRKVYFTTEEWYPALCRFFDRIEAETGVRIEIAGHYKSTHPAIAPIFGNRHVYYGKTAELVRNSEFVITRASTATSYAVAFRKPIVFIYSNQLNEDRKAMRDGRGIAAVLGKELVNIDEPDLKISDLLEVNEERYVDYENACLTSAKSRGPNVQIILEDIMNIAPGPELFNENR